MNEAILTFNRSARGALTQAITTFNKSARGALNEARTTFNRELCSKLAWGFKVPVIWGQFLK